jgi:O-antigen/teichoic acid export membrane protein
MFRRRRADLLILAVLFLLPLLLFWPVTLGGKTLLPIDNLYQWQPWKAAAEQFNAQIPQNQLVSDLILENYAWKHFIVESISKGQIPLWNPNLFAGAPFLANGQHSAYYPFSVLFYFLPLTLAYGWFTVSQLFLAGAFMYVFTRVLGMGRLAGLTAAIIYQLSGFYIVSVDFTMIIAAAAWLPLLLAAIELIIQQRSIMGRPATIPWIVLGAIALACQIMAGHIEITYYTLLIMALYAVWRLVAVARSKSTNRRIGESTNQRDSESTTRGTQYALRSTVRVLRRPVLALIVLVLLGVGMSAIQLLPNVEILSQNFRMGSATLDQVRGWALPPRHVLEMLMPNFFGNPAEHTVFDIMTMQNVLLNSPFNAQNPQGAYSTMWGIKNYVEGGAYLGILPLLLAIYAIVRGGYPHTRSHRLFFVFLAAISLAFMFGTPLYAILYYGLPGINQLHSPFRWIWPFTISIAVLAAIGVDALMIHYQRDKYVRPRKGLIKWFCLNGPVSFRTILAGLAFWPGAIILVGLFASRLIFPAQSIDLADKLLQSMALANTAFDNPQLFYSHLWRNVLLFASFLTMSGVVLRVSLCPIFVPLPRGRQVAIWKPLLLIVIALDLLVGAIGFNPAVDPKLLDYTPPVIAFLKHDASQWRFTTFDPHGRKTFNANGGWPYGMQDVRGYDSIILKQYADYMGVIEAQNETQFNRIQPITTYGGLDSPMLDLLNVKYVLTDPDVPIESPKYKLVYDAEVKVYENLGVLPRAFTMSIGCETITDDPLAALKQHDPRSTVIVEKPADRSGAENPVCALQAANVVDYQINDVVLKTQVDQPSWLVLNDTYFTGWLAYNVQADGTEKEVPIYRAYGNFRAVPIEAGESTVHFKYSPMSFKLGLFISFMAWMIVIFLLAIWLWRLAYREEKHAGTTTQRVAKNSLAPMALNLFNRVIDFAFAALMLRILQPENAGNFYFAVVIVGWVEIFTNFGLNTFLTREVSRDRSGANRFFANTSILRLILGGIALPVLIIALLIGNGLFQLTQETAITIVLLALAQIPSSLSTGMTAMFYAYEKAEYPAALGVVTVLLKVFFGVPALLAGWGIIGLGVVSLLVNCITFVVLTILLRRLIMKPRYENDPTMRRGMLHESFPLMLNHLLATLFFKVDVPMLQAIQGPTVVGWYSTAYKWIDALNIIPAYSTMALFPVMSRQATEDKEALMRSTRFAIKFLVMVALPIAVMTTFLAPLLVLILGGQSYLPNAAIALQIMIWSIPFGWINSIVNYILIALGQQSKLTRAFVIGLTFNISANLILIPRFSFVAAAVVTILSELVEGLVFMFYLERSLGSIQWIRLLWRLFVSAGAMFVLMGLAWAWHPIAGVVVGPIAYAGMLVLLKAIGPEEKRVLDRLRGSREAEENERIGESTASTI